jgi:hypothetical protein
VKQHNNPQLTHQPTLGHVVGYGPFSLCVIHKEDLCPSNGDINRLMMNVNCVTSKQKKKHVIGWLNFACLSPSAVNVVLVRPQARWSDDLRWTAGESWIRVADRARWRAIRKAYVQQWTVADSDDVDNEL